TRPNFRLVRDAGGRGCRAPAAEAQNGQLPGAGVTSIPRVASFGMSWTTTVFAAAPLSSRMMWTAPPPMSTNEFVPLAEYTCGVHGREWFVSNGITVAPA